MGQLEAQERHLSITVQESNEANSLPDRRRGFNWWLRMFIYTVFVLVGQAIATLLGRQYYEKGGKSNWLATLVQICGFPIFLPYYCIPAWNKNCPTTNSTIAVESKPPSTLVLASVYGVLGTLIAADYYLYSLGISYLPVSTFALISASQLVFNAIFSFFLNSQKITPYIVNSLVVLIISSSLLVLQGDGSADSIVATAIILVGFFASGDWKGVTHEMQGFQLGKVAYIMNVTWTAINWQLFQMGVVGLVFEASSLFSNSIGAVGLPIVPVLAVIFFHEKMDGIKVVSLVLAIWGFISYVYQHYLDDCKSKSEKKAANYEVSKALPLENISDKAAPICNPNMFVIPVQEAEPAISQPRNFKWWLRIAIYTLFVLFGQSAAILLGRLYYNKVSTFSLICASQLVFNAFFSFFLNAQKFTPYIANSLVLLTISSMLLVFHATSMNVAGISKEKYIIGIVCTVGASAGYGLMFSLTQVAFQKVLKSNTFTAVLEMIISESVVATCATLVGLFVSKEMKGLKREMEEFELGRLFYFVTLACTAAAWQAFNIGAIGLIFEVSALFSNVICVSGLPFVPVLAVIFFNDSMDGIKVIATVLAIWGFASYLYQHYLDNLNSNPEIKPVTEISMIPLLKETSC
ncbi:hypothetical protein ACLB2K_024970 [Fragaria x ananassa]